MKKNEAKNLKVGDLVIRTMTSSDSIYEVKDIVWDDEGIPMRITLHYVESVKYGKPLFTNNNDDCLTYKKIRYLTDDERAELNKQRLERATMHVMYMMGIGPAIQKILVNKKSIEES